ncbi:SAM-dependent methyltransferase [Streptomonospora sp. S1-112]|uniref:SAM-dependent methyltransferase n=1 Tax=Streptomonospora mangrovi TaxID=2883123 RepID=A0A9X3SH13_9ACTN|nr:SAM-dependent methyltransferase [Streptomonospora mangrovi]MDA0567462.1 SAM-dependent methyltransferase [Streptomonospora mangrovi]
MSAPTPPGPPAPAGVDTTVPSAARLYDYYLDGKNNYAVDREMGGKLLKAVPELKMAAHANRLFLGRAVEFMAEQGVDQFVDVGSGLPTQDPVHEVARRHIPDARVVYVDHDPVVRVHAEALLADRPEITGVVLGDMREPEKVFRADDLVSRIDLNRPVGLLLIAVLHFLKDEQAPYELVRRYLDRLAPGSYIAITHLERDTHPERADFLQQMYESTSSPGQIRSGDEIARFFADVTLVEPGLVHIADWRPRDTQPYYSPEQVWGLGGVARWDGPARS